MEKEFNINNVKVKFVNFDNAIEDMAKAAIDYANEHKENEKYVISELIVTKNDDVCDFDVKYNDEDQPKFGRIRRITGYLTGTVDRWNSAKQHELEERVTHVG